MVSASVGLGFGGEGASLWNREGIDVTALCGGSCCGGRLELELDREFW